MDSLYLFPPDDNPQKCCKGPCGRTLPATPEYFQRDKNQKYGLQSWCKECRQAKRRKPPVVDNIPEGCKRCGGCTNIFPATPEYFHQFNRSKDGLVSQCKECVSKRGKEWRDLPEVKEHKQAWEKTYNSRPEIKAHKSAQGKAYHSRPEVRKHQQARQKAYNSRPEIQARNSANKKIYRSTLEYQQRQRERVEDWLNRPGIREHRRNYLKSYYHKPENIERTRGIGRANSHKRRALKKSVKGAYTPQQIQDKLKAQKHKCYYCQKRLQKIKGKCIYHIEHTFPINRVEGMDIPANSIDYLVISCPTCNLSKRDRFPWEWAEGGRLL